MRVLFSIVANVKGDRDMTYHALALINGIIEDKRSRIKVLTTLQGSNNKDKALDCIGILNSFLIVSHENDQEFHRDLAAHVNAMLIEAYEFKKCAHAARNFMLYLFDQKDIFVENYSQHKKKPAFLSKIAFTTALMYMVKTNELARDFCDRQGFFLMKCLLEDCTKISQIAYNVTCTLWILSFHPFAIKGFTDYQLGIIEGVTKILDYFNKEKIVRIVLMLFDNIKTDSGCLEHLSMVNAFNLVTKLQNRPWVDGEIVELLEKLWKYFDQNYHEFSSFEKWKRQVERKQLTWSPVHTEKFWQASFIFFNEADNLACIDILIELLKVPQNSVAHGNVDTMKSVACYDLGEFARFFPLGQQYLESKGAKAAIGAIMQNPQSSPELKKEAITAYQKLLMNSWGQSN